MPPRGTTSSLLSFLLLSLFLLPVVSPLRFLAMGDWGTTHENKDDSQVRVSQAMAQVAADSPIDFVVTLGDNFYEDGVKDENDPLWTTDYEKVYYQPSLNKPWYAVLGNHDHLGSITAQILYHNKNPRWNFPSRYYFQTFSDPLTHLNLTILFLDSEPFVENQDDSDQWNWIQTTLARKEVAESDWVVLAAHHPVVYCGEESGNQSDFDRYTNRMMKVLVTHGVDLFISGHKHNLQHHVKNGVNFVVSGSGGRLSDLHHKHCPPPENFRWGQSTNGFAQLEVTTSQIQISMFDSSATMVYNFSIARNGDSPRRRGRNGRESKITVQG